jgi:hypothetical protein
LQTPPQSSKAFTLVYQTRICFQFPPSVRVFSEILTNQGVNYSFIPHSKTTSFWALKLHRFRLQNDVVLAILSLIFLKKIKRKEKIKRKILKKKGGQKSGVAPATPLAKNGVASHPHGWSGGVEPPPWPRGWSGHPQKPKAKKKEKKKKKKNGFRPTESKYEFGTLK